MAIPNNTATILAGATLSSVLSKGHKNFTKIFVENFNGTGNIALQGSRDGLTFYDIITYVPGAANVSVVFTITNPAGSTANFLTSFLSEWLEELNYLRFRANAVINSGTCTITMY